MLTYQSTKTKTICPYCSSTAVPDNSKEEKEIICPNELCKKHFSFIICPFCQQKIFFRSSFDNKSNNNHKHTGIYCKVMDWEKNKPIKFIDLLNGKSV